MKRPIVIALMLTIVALGFRLYLALRLPNEEPGDAKIYALIARNVLDHHIYSSDDEEPLQPTYIRVPGYPLLLVSVYTLFGEGNDRAVRVIQTIVDTFTCWLIALLALAWSPSLWAIAKRRRAMFTALALAALCPFTAIYVTVLLTEVWTMFFVMGCALAATYALKSETPLKASLWWTMSGIGGGLATMFRPDSPFFIAGVGLTFMLIGLGEAFIVWRNQNPTPETSAVNNPASSTDEKNSATLSPPSTLAPPSTIAPRSPWQLLGRTILRGVIFSSAFLLVLLPWVVRNERVYKVFMPFAPASASMPGEFVPVGYNAWLRTWVDNWYYTEKADWAMGERAIQVDQLPAYAFDSEDEKARVTELLNQYNHPDAAQPVTVKEEEDKNSGDDADDSSGDDDEDQAAADDDAGDEADAGDKAIVRMTPEIDLAFAEIAHQRIAQHAVRYYFLTPLKRARHMWFSTHSQYYPFSGDDLFPEDGEHDQKFWLPLFKGLILLYTILATGGLILLAVSRETRRWVLLFGLLIFPRLVYLATLQNPEPRYVVEFFPLVMAAASIALASINYRRQP